MTSTPAELRHYILQQLEASLPAALSGDSLFANCRASDPEVTRLECQTALASLTRHRLAKRHVADVLNAERFSITNEGLVALNAE